MQYAFTIIVDPDFHFFASLLFMELQTEAAPLGWCSSALAYDDSRFQALYWKRKYMYPDLA